MIVSSRKNPAVRALRALADKKGRREAGSYLAEGKKLVAEALSLGLPVRRVAAAENALGFLADLPAPPETLVLTREAFAAITTEKSPEGVLAEIALPSTVPLPPEGDCLLLDGVADPGNVGTLLRSAAAAGFSAAYLVDCADPFSPKAVRAAMGGVFRTKIYEGTRDEVLRALGDAFLVAADMRGENAFSFRPPLTFCLAVGSEANGLSREVAAAARASVCLPMEGGTESLNAAVAGSALAFILKNNRKGA